MKRFFIFLFLGLVMVNAVKAQDVLYNRQDSVAYEQYIKKMSGQKDKAVDQLIVATAKYFRGKPYVASTLEKSDKETLIVNLHEFDCTTFVENCIALSLVLKGDDYSFGRFCEVMRSIRYRNGKTDGYISRLHYTSDWIYENEKNGVLEDITVAIGGQRALKDINFMSSHSSLYKHLKDNTSNIAKIESIEKVIAERDSYAIVPKSSVAGVASEIKDGDIIVFATAVDGLDYSHIGIAYWQSGKLHFIHASSKMKKVVIEQKTLSEYCLTSKNCTGISVLRISDK